MSYLRVVKVIDEAFAEFRASLSADAISHPLTLEGDEKRREAAAKYLVAEDFLKVLKPKLKSDL